MEMESGKVFVGGISWDTSEERMKEYFEAFGEVVEAVIMKDRTTGRARGFGFVVFADAFVAEKVVRERHVIDGRTVEAKKAVPRDDHQNFSRNSTTSSIQGSPGPARTKKIFVGGLASTVTETDFKLYFDQFGTITDVVVMYDHNTQRPRGFGFITYDSEEAVDKVLTKTFHELNGKMVEVKRAVPKELSPGPTRSPSAGNNYGLNRVSSLLNAYGQGYNSSSGVGGYGMRMDGRFSPVNVGRSGYPPYSPFNYSTGYGANGDSGSGYVRGMNSYYKGNPNRYGSPIGYDVAVNVPLLNNTNRNLLGNENINNGVNSLFGSGSGNAGVIGNFGSVREIWGLSGQGGGNSGTLSSGNIGYGNGEHNFGTRGVYGRNNVGSGVRNNVGDGIFGNLYGGESFYLDHGWRSSTPELEGPTSFGYGRGLDGDATTPNGYVGGYIVDARSNRGIAA